MHVNNFPSIKEKPITIDHLACFKRNQITSAHSPTIEETVNNFTSFVFIESGTAFVCIGDKNFILESGNIIFIPPSQFHLVKSADGLQVTYIYVSIKTDSDIIKKIVTKPIRCNKNHYCYITTALDHAERALSTITNDLNSTETLKELYAKKFNHIMQITYNCLELFLLLLSSNIEIEPVKESHKQTRHANITASVEEFLRERVKENISLQETAQHFGYSISNIQKIFKAVTGESIIVYFNKLKLEEAKRLIIENNMTFSQISSYLSFSNPNYFSRIFKTTVGMTPTEYANLHLKERKNYSSYKKKSSSKLTRNKDS